MNDHGNSYGCSTSLAGDAMLDAVARAFMETLDAATAVQPA